MAAQGGKLWIHTVPRDLRHGTTLFVPTFWETSLPAIVQACLLLFFFSKDILIGFHLAALLCSKRAAYFIHWQHCIPWHEQGVFFSSNCWIFLRIFEFLLVRVKKKFSTKKLTCFFFSWDTRFSILIAYNVRTLSQMKQEWNFVLYSVCGCRRFAGFFCFFCPGEFLFVFFCGNEKLILQPTNAISPAHATLFGLMLIPQYPYHLQKRLDSPQKITKCFQDLVSFTRRWQFPFGQMFASACVSLATHSWSNLKECIIAPLTAGLKKFDKS